MGNPLLECYFFYKTCHFGIFRFDAGNKKAPPPELLPEEERRVAFCYVPGKRFPVFPERPVRPAGFSGASVSSMPE